MRRFLTAAAAVVLAAVLITAPAYAAKKASITVSPSAVAPGGTVHVSGSIPVKGCPASDGATVVGQAALFPPDGFGPTTKRDANGDLALDYTVPTSTPAGTYDIGLRCGTCGRRVLVARRDLEKDMKRFVERGPLAPAD